MTPQAWVSAGAVLLVLVFMVTSIIVLPLPEGFRVGKALFLTIVIAVGITMCIAIVYGVDCMMSGNCSGGSWLITIVLVWICLFYIIVASLNIWKSIKERREESEKTVESETKKTSAVVKISSESGQIV